MTSERIARQVCAKRLKDPDNAGLADCMYQGADHGVSIADAPLGRFSHQKGERPSSFGSSFCGVGSLFAALPKSNTHRVNLLTQRLPGSAVQAQARPWPVVGPSDGVRYVDFCEKVSLADFVVMAANAVIKSTREPLRWKTGIV